MPLYTVHYVLSTMLTPQAMAISNRLHAEWKEADQLQKTMRALQLEDEDPALALAIAASLRDQAARDAELADIEQVGAGVLDRALVVLGWLEGRGLALALAIAASLRDQAARDAELADIEHWRV